MAAYGLHICKNHPLFDGNKRTALVAIYTFLYVKGDRLQADKKGLYAVMIDLADGKVEKEELTKFLKENTKERK
ncbi:type II toxin-antitoxin system death-on-curing family toxin [Fodinibius salsisoli]|uniref:Type II toxin-antitoxin system death-on-curing family toxin n=1 Tax=Fodinibius salsisoli TaxID=2820877 RepID=A0ABT3PP90_9BACT|nr:type II toxin-antitoxin system death-on-curing family toxin [Fodinibius salsisoli]